MLSTLQAFVALMGAALALPSPIIPADDLPPVRILPYSWLWNITALSGPGCPDFGADYRKSFVTRSNHGANTVDGSEIYYWFFAYPHLRASVGPGTPQASIWCETTLSYTEYAKGGLAEAAEYRAKLHKNGTAVTAQYNLEEGVTAQWKSTYYTDDGEIVDSITIAGPRKAGSYSDNSPVVSPLVRWPLQKCGSGTIRYRTELTVTAAKEGAKGIVDSEAHKWDDGNTYHYGVLHGFSFDFEKCAA